MPTKMEIPIILEENQEQDEAEIYVLYSEDVHRNLFRDESDKDRKPKKSKKVDEV